MGLGVVEKGKGEPILMNFNIKLKLIVKNETVLRLNDT